MPPSVVVNWSSPVFAAELCSSDRFLKPWCLGVCQKLRARNANGLVWLLAILFVRFLFFILKEYWQMFLFLFYSKGVLTDFIYFFILKEYWHFYFLFYYFKGVLTKVNVNSCSQAILCDLTWFSACCHNANFLINLCHAKWSCTSNISKELIYHWFVSLQLP